MGVGAHADPHPSQGAEAMQPVLMSGKPAAVVRLFIRGRFQPQHHASFIGDAAQGLCQLIVLL
jgi:hypothetical protein